MTKDYYKILGVAEFDSADKIKSAYRSLARKWHPDIAGSTKDVLLKFKEINEAYEVLSNKTKKAEYDKARRFYNYTQDNKKEEPNTNYKNTTNPQFEKKSFNFNWDNIWNKNFSENIKASQKGENITSDVEITSFEAFSGVNKTINVLQTHVCPKCKGKKFVNGTICKHCNGKGEFVDYKKFNVKIPAGIKNGSKIRLAGEGGKGINGGENGDLYLKIHIADISNDKQENLDIFKTVEILPQEAVLGTKITVKHNNETYCASIAPDTQNGQKIRLAKCGNCVDGKFGDLIITIVINIPKNLREEEILLYRKLAEISNKNIHNFNDV